MVKRGKEAFNWAFMESESVCAVGVGFQQLDLHKLFTCILLLLVLLMCGNARAANLSLPRYYLAATGTESKMLFGGGQYNITSGDSNVVDIYDVNTDIWSTATLSRGRTRLAAAAAGSKVLFGGGQYATVTNSDVVDIYDVNTGTWSTDILSQARAWLAAAAAGSKVLFAGGQYNSSSVDSNVVDIYDIDTGIWSTATLSQARSRLGAAGAGSKVLFGGGLYSNGTTSNVVDIYDVNTGTWSTDILSQGRSRLEAASAGSKVLFGGGQYTSTTSTDSDVVDIYDVNTGTWSTASLSQARYRLAAAGTGNKVLFAGGQNSAITASNVVDIYDVNTGIWSAATLSQARGYFAAAGTGAKVVFGGGQDNGFASDMTDIFDYTVPPPTNSMPCVGPAPLAGAVCQQGTWITTAAVTLDAPLQLSSSAPLIISGDLDQNGNDIVASISSLNNSSTSLLYVNSSARLNGALILHLQEPLTPSALPVVIPILQAKAISGTFDHVNVTSASSNDDPRFKCPLQKSTGRTLSVLLESSCKKGAGIPVVALVVPLVCLTVLISMAVLGWYLIRVRRVWRRMDWLFHSGHQEPQEPTEYYRM